MKGKKPRLPKILYHYTTVTAFRSIIENGIMRASRYDQMNDRDELQFGVKHLLRSLELREIDKEDLEYSQFLIKGIQGFRSKDFDVYVLSFSAEADSLDQWRAYCPNGGVAIGFDSAKVRKGFLLDVTRRAGGIKIENPVRPVGDAQLLKCKYSKKDGSFASPAQLTDLFFQQNSYPAAFQRMHEFPFQEQIFMATLSASIYRRICLVKHGAYKAEKEWRSVNWRPDPVDFPMQLSEKNRFFIEYSFEPADYIREVYIAPHGDTQGARNAAEFLKTTLGLSYKIRESSIPYRI